MQSNYYYCVDILRTALLSTYICMSMVYEKSYFLPTTRPTAANEMELYLK